MGHHLCVLRRRRTIDQTAETRRKRDAARAKVRDRVEPLAERKQEKLGAHHKVANTFGDVAKEYIDKMVAKGRAGSTITKANWRLMGWPSSTRM